MPTICPMQGCKEIKGMCIHDKFMAITVIAIVAVLISIYLRIIPL